MSSGRRIPRWRPWRPGVSGRVLGTMLLPLLLLAVVSVRVTLDEHQHVRAAERVNAEVDHLEDLFTLRTAMFAERLASELSVEGRRPPQDLLATTQFGEQVRDDPGSLVEATDRAFTAIAPGRRPFDAAQLAAARAVPADGDSAVGIAQRWDPLRQDLTASIESLLAEIRGAAVQLGDPTLVQAVNSLDASMLAPERSAEMLAALSDLWTAPPQQRPALQSEVAAAVSRFEAVDDRLATTGIERVRAAWLDGGRMPDELRSVVDDALSGGLTDPSAPSGTRLDIGLALLDGIDWTIAVNDLTSVATGTVNRIATEAALAARRSQQTTVVLTLVAMAASVASALLFGRSIVVPVRRLTDQATSVGRGDLSLEPLELAGPPEVVRASAAFNDVVDNLVLLERKTHALADCDFDDPVLSQPLPGKLGASLQRSVRVLSGSIIQRQQLQHRLAHQASHDALTGLANRAALVALLEDTQRHRHLSGPLDQQLAVVFIDLDGFKRANDRYGHAVGDELLRVVGQRMLDQVRRGEMVARLGGDEFVVVLPSVLDAQEPVELARRLVRAVAEPVEIEGSWVSVGASAGVALSGLNDDTERDPLDLLRCADLAVYAAKERSGDPVALYDDEMDQLIVVQEDIEAGLSAAIEEGHGELSLAFQPQVDALTGDPVGFEVLVRWNRAERGPVSPGLFVPIAERSGLIVDLDLWIIGSALRQLDGWADDPTLGRATLAVNVSGRSVLDMSFVERFTSVLAAAEVAPARLTLEVTETALVTDLDLMAAQLDALRGLGVRVAIDDFGTGYTSVAHLRALPVDEIKIDLSFVQGLPDRENYLLIQMINELARRLDVPTVAEGVETVDQLEALREIGCDYLQGYLFARPMPASELPGWVRSVERGRSLDGSATVQDGLSPR